MGHGYREDYEFFRISCGNPKNAICISYTALSIGLLPEVWTVCVLLSVFGTEGKFCTVSYFAFLHRLFWNYVYPRSRKLRLTTVGDPPR
jgi:hypothetical protein